MSNEEVVHIYFPGHNKGPTLAFDYPIRPGGLAFHGPEKRLDRLVQEKILRKVETNKINLPNGVHMLNIPYHKWEDPHFNPNIKTSETVNPIDETIPVPAGFRSAVPSEITESLKAMNPPAQEDATPPVQPRVMTTDAMSSGPARRTPTAPIQESSRLPSVDPASGAAIVPPEGPMPDLSIETDPEWLAEQNSSDSPKILSMDEVTAMSSDDVVELAQNHGFKGSNKNRAIALLIDRGIVKAE